MAISLPQEHLLLLNQQRVGALLRSIVLAKGGVLYPMQETSGSVAVATNPAVALGRDVVIGGTFPDDPGDWTLGANWSIAGNAATHAASNTADLSQDGIVAAGSSWQLIFTVSNRTAGSVTPKMGVSGTARSTNATFTETIGSTGTDLDFTPTSDFDGDITAVSVQQVDIAASSSFSTPGDNPLDGAITGATVGVDAGPFLDRAYSFDGLVDFVDIYSAEINSVFNPDAGTLLAFARVTDAGVWTDGTIRYIVDFRVDANNNLSISKSSVNNQISAVYEASGVTDAVSDVSLAGTTEWFMVAFTWDAGPADKVELFINDTSVGESATLSDFIGNFPSTQVVIGAINTTPNNPWDGDMDYVALLPVALTAAEIARIARAGGVA